MSSNNDLPTAPVLRNSLEAMGLSTWGSREVMYQRLISGGEKKKPGPKPKTDGATKTIAKKTSGVSTSTKAPPMFDAGELKFFAEERPRLIAQGITDPVAQNTELKRRYMSLKKATSSPGTMPAAGKKATANHNAKAAGDTVVIPSTRPLSEAELKQLGLVLQNVEPDSNGKIMYNYHKKAVGKCTDAKCDADKSDGDSDGDSDEDSDNDSAMDECEDIVTMRLAKRGTKEWLAQGCELYGVAVSGSKKQLAERLAEQVCNETDDEEDDE